MKAPHRTRPFLAAYRFAPQRALNRLAGRVARLERPRGLVRFAVDRWIRALQRSGQRLDDFEHGANPGAYPSVHAFFLRRLAEGARPLGERSLVVPADGVVMAAGRFEPDREIVVKGHPLSPRRLFDGGDPMGRQPTDLAPFAGGAYAVIFLTPDGYHFVHTPCAGELREVRWIPGRYFPQNADALRVIPRVYERNERATLRLTSVAGAPILLSMVGASLIGGIHLRGLQRERWVRPAATRVDRPLERGDELGYFSFGSTVVLLLPPELARTGELALSVGQRVRMGEPLTAL